MKKLIMGWMVLGIMFGIVGCNSTDDDSIENPPAVNHSEDIDEKSVNETDETDNENNTEESQIDLEEEKKVDMMIEGMIEEKTVHLHTHQDLGFSTYVPNDMIVETTSTTFDVFTNFNDTKNENATLRITDHSEEQVIDNLEQNGFTLTNQDATAYEFAQKEYTLQKEGMIGRVVVFEHSGHGYIFYYYYPMEMADGFAPRSDIIINELLWHNMQ